MVPVEKHEVRHSPPQQINHIRTRQLIDILGMLGILGMHMNKTLYIRDEDAGVWERARELAGDKLSPVVVNALKQFVTEKEASARGHVRIVLKYKDGELPKAKAFCGTWIIPPHERFCEKSDEPLFGIGNHNDDVGLQRCFSIAITAKGAVVVFSFWSDRTSGTQSNEKFETYPSLLAASEVYEYKWAMSETFARYGVPIEELDL
jgi:hypothetical protein